MLILKHDYLDVKDKLPVDGERILNLGMFEFSVLFSLAFIFESLNFLSVFTSFSHYLILPPIVFPHF